MTRPATSGGATPSCSGWRSRIWGAKESAEIRSRFSARRAKLRFSKSHAVHMPAFIGGMMKLGTLSRAVLAMAGSLAAVVAFAQTDGTPASSGISLPTKVDFIETRDPNVRKATAIVNGVVITESMVDHRLALIVLSAAGQQI